ncbi:hypothetical protein UlMin_010588 [Ulmus minor]
MFTHNFVYSLIDLHYFVSQSLNLFFNTYLFSIFREDLMLASYSVASSLPLTGIYSAMALAGRFICSITGIDSLGGFHPSLDAILEGLGYATPSIMALLFILYDEVVKLSPHARAIRDVEDEELQSFFYGMSPWQFILVIVASSVGEELFYKAVVQLALPTYLPLQILWGLLIHLILTPCDLRNQDIINEHYDEFVKIFVLLVKLSNKLAPSHGVHIPPQFDKSPLVSGILPQHMGYSSKHSYHKVYFLSHGIIPVHSAS